MDLPHLHGIVPPMATPLVDDGRSLDEPGLNRLATFLLDSGVHGLWVLGTTARFDLLPDRLHRRVAEIVAERAAGRVPLVVNVSDMGTARVRERARMVDDLPYDYYAVLPPWYQPMTPAEVGDFYRGLADTLRKPLVIYNAPWICNQLSFEQLRELAAHPRIVGCKDVTPALCRTLDWSAEERRAQGFSYLHGNDLLALSTSMGADGFVTSLSNVFPELMVAQWNAARSADAADSYRLLCKATRLGRIGGFGSNLACLEAACKHRGLFDRMLPEPLRSLDPSAARRVAEVLEAEGIKPIRDRA